MILSIFDKFSGKNKKIPYMCLQLIPIPIGTPWMPIRMRQNDADSTRSGSRIHNTGYLTLVCSVADAHHLHADPDPALLIMKFSF
jgi:hypothetical protein